MKLKEFRKMFKGLPSDTEVMIVADWMTCDETRCNPLLCDANAICRTFDTPMGIGDDGRNIVYIYNDPDKE